MSFPLRVLMAVPHYPYPVGGGLERQSHELAKALLKLGVDVQALAHRFHPSQSMEEVVEGVRVHRIPWSPRKYVRFIRTPFDLLWVLYGHRRSFDIVHLHQYSWFGAFVILSARLLGKPVLMKLPSVGSHSIPGIAVSRFGSLKLAIFKMADAVVAMSRQSIQELEAINYPLCRVLPTPNGIRVLTGEASPCNNGATPGICRVVFVGRLSPEKRIDDLLHAWRLVKDSTSVPVRLELWGRGAVEAEMKSLSSSLGIADSVVFCGHIDSVRDRLGEMDIFVLTSTIEGNSNAILEAMAAGLPIVSTRVGGTPMLVGALGARFLIEPGDRHGLFARLLELIDDDGLRQRLGGAMRERILAHFEINHVAATYAAAYSRLAAGRRDQVSEVGDPVIAEN